jgi:hypothetical protein
VCAFTIEVLVSAFAATRSRMPSSRSSELVQAANPNEKTAEARVKKAQKNQRSARPLGRSKSLAAAGRGPAVGRWFAAFAATPA